MEAPLDNNTVFIAGGADGDEGSRTSYCATYFLDLNTKAWTPGPNMSHCRYYHTCNLVRNSSSGNNEIVVVGGFDQQRQDDCEFLQYVEIFNLDSMQWRNGEQSRIQGHVYLSHISWFQQLIFPNPYPATQASTTKILS